MKGIRDLQGFIDFPGGFRFLGDKPLDARLVGESVEFLDSILEAGGAYPGLRVFIESENKAYVYKKDENGVYAFSLDVQGVDFYQTKADDSLETESKNIVGAINELNKKVGQEGSEVVVDPTLTVEGAAADAKATGEALSGKLDTSGGTMTAPLYFTSERTIRNNKTGLIHLLTVADGDVITHNSNSKVLMVGSSAKRLDLRGTSLTMNGEDISEYLRIPRLYKHIIPLPEADWFNEGSNCSAWLEIIDDSIMQYGVESDAIMDNSGNRLSAKLRFNSTNTGDTSRDLLLHQTSGAIDGAHYYNPFTNTFENVFRFGLQVGAEDTVTELVNEGE